MHLRIVPPGEQARRVNPPNRAEMPYLRLIRPEGHGSGPVPLEPEYPPAEQLCEPEDDRPLPDPPATSKQPVAVCARLLQRLCRCRGALRDTGDCTLKPKGGPHARTRPRIADDRRPPHAKPHTHNKENEAMDRIKVRVTGRLTRDPEPKQYNGDTFTEITVAANQGNREQQDSLFFRARVYGRQGEVVAEHGFKGREVTVEGDLKCRTFDKQDGSKGYAHDIQYAEVNLHGPGRSGPGASADYGSETGEEEMPF